MAVNCHSLSHLTFHTVIYDCTVFAKLSIFSLLLLFILPRTHWRSACWIDYFNHFIHSLKMIWLSWMRLTICQSVIVGWSKLNFLKLSIMQYNIWHIWNPNTNHTDLHTVLSLNFEGSLSYLSGLERDQCLILTRFTLAHYLDHPDVEVEN